MTAYSTNGGIADGDFTGNGKADLAYILSSCLWYQNGATLGWKRIVHIAPFRLTDGNVTGD
jgi:hypothetical protein